MQLHEPKPLANWRIALLGLCFLAGLTLAGMRLYRLQVVQSAAYEQRQMRQSVRRVLLPSPRGRILDRHGRLLADNQPNYCLALYVEELRRPGRWSNTVNAVDVELNRLADVLQLPRSCSRANIEKHIRQSLPLPLIVWEHLGDVALARLTECRENFPGVDVFVQPERLYPHGKLAAHVLGYAGGGDLDAEARAGDYHYHLPGMKGRGGVEQEYDDLLCGLPGGQLIRVDAAGYRHDEWIVRQPVPGRDLTLTLDLDVQASLENAMSGVRGAGVVMDPRNGEILAMATLPNFDPNDPGGVTPDKRKNRVIADVAEPGSTFKIVVVSGALNDRIVQLSDGFDCAHGHFLFAGHMLHDHEPYDVLSVQQIISKSSNIGAAKIGIKMGSARLYEYIRDFGFGVRTGILLPGEVVGIVHPLKDWYRVSIAQIPMGQGISVTRLQMTLAMCAISNKGLLMRPMLVDRLEDRDHRVVAQYAPQRVRQVISESAAKSMVTALKTVVSTNGTAPKAALEHYTTAGKTGTAQKFENGRLARDKYFASFIGFFPADNPEVCIAVMIDEPKKGYYGGQIAAPIFKQIAEPVANYLNIRPEDGSAPSVAANVAMPIDNRSVKTAAARSQSN